MPNRFHRIRIGGLGCVVYSPQVYIALERMREVVVVNSAGMLHCCAEISIDTYLRGRKVFQYPVLEGIDARTQYLPARYTFWGLPSLQKVYRAGRYFFVFFSPENSTHGRWRANCAAICTSPRRRTPWSILKRAASSSVSYHPRWRRRPRPQRPCLRRLGDKTQSPCRRRHPAP